MSRIKLVIGSWCTIGNYRDGLTLFTTPRRFSHLFLHSRKKQAKYMGITKVSKATATRDLQQLHEIGVLVQKGAGRSVHYQLNL